VEKTMSMLRYREECDDPRGRDDVSDEGWLPEE